MTAAPRNPYRPGVGREPAYLAGRGPQLAEFTKVLRGAPEIPANIRLTGLRGVGKTVLLSHYHSLAAAENWAAVRFETEPRHATTERALLETIRGQIEVAARQMSATAKLKAASLQLAQRAAITVSYEDIALTLGAGSTPVEVDLSKALYDVTHTALSKGYIGFLLLIDEAHIIRDATKGVHRKEGGHPLSALLAAISGLQKHDLPVGIVLCGLPPLAGNLLKARTYSERMFRAQTVGSLAREDAMDAFTKPLESSGVSVRDELAMEVATEVEGYPFFIQLYGAELWDAAMEAGLPDLSVDLLDSVRPLIMKRLDLEFYANRLETLTPAEQDLVLDMVKCPYPPIHVSDVRDASVKTDKNVNVLLGRIAEAGTVYRVRQGQYEFTAPKFRDFLLRHIAERDDPNQPPLWPR